MFKYTGTKCGSVYGRVVRENTGDGSRAVVLATLSSVSVAQELAQELQNAYDMGLARGSGTPDSDLESSGVE